MPQPLPYFMSLKVEPNAELNQPQLAGIKGAIANIWVFETSMDRAKEKAIRYIREHGWCLIEERHAFQAQPEQISRLGTGEVMNYHHAELLGINAHFGAWPEKSGPGD